MSKPIFIIRFPHSDEKRREYIEILENMRRTLKDYHVFSVMDNKTDKVEFECYNPDNDVILTDLKFQNKLRELSQAHPNDSDLGKAVRKLYDTFPELLKEQK